jgi:ketosteroid isomerase-like protein
MSTATTDQQRPMLDAVAFAADAERITNDVLLEEWLGLYHDDAVVEWVADGAYERHEGIDAIRRAATAMAATWADQRLRVRKTVECADADTIVLTWRGGFRGAQRQFGTEIWTLRDGRVVRHQMYAYLDLRPSSSLKGRLRLLISAPRVAVSFVRNQGRARPPRDSWSARERPSSLATGTDLHLRLDALSGFASQRTELQERVRLGFARELDERGVRSRGGPGVDIHHLCLEGS